MGLMDILNGMQNGPRGQTQSGKGGMSPVTMALLALLAYKAYQKYSEQHPGATPAQAPAGLPGGGMAGGLGSGLGGGLGGLLGGLLGGGAAGGALSGGLGDLLKQFDQGGLGDIAKSWIGTGANKSISPGQLGQVLDNGMLAQLAQQFGVPKGELLEGLSQQMPELVDKLTPHGRVPDAHEMSKMV